MFIDRINANSYKDWKSRMLLAYTFFCLKSKCPNSYPAECNRKENYLMLKYE